MRLAASRPMEPVTHALASLTLGRAGLGRLTRWGTPMLLVSGLAADADWSSYEGGAPAFLQWHRTASHSLLAAGAISAVVATGFWLADRRNQASRRVGYLTALAVCAAGAGLHLLLDLTNSAGVKLLWPFQPRWFAWDLAPEVDPALLVILLAGLLLPTLLHLVGEEIGARSQKRPGARGAVIALCLAAAYLGGRTVGHMRAQALLAAHVYNQEAPIRTGAFPTASPLRWRGVVETQTALHEAEVPLTPGASFDPRAARTDFKPDESPVLDHAVASEAARTFLAFARFPLARVQPVGDGYEVRLRDLRQLGSDLGAIVAVVSVNARGEVTGSELRFDPSDRR
jgi:inner membrane protein